MRKKLGQALRKLARRIDPAVEYAPPDPKLAALEKQTRAIESLTSTVNGQASIAGAVDTGAVGVGLPGAGAAGAAGEGAAPGTGLGARCIPGIGAGPGARCMAPFGAAESALALSSTASSTARLTPASCTV